MTFPVPRPLWAIASRGLPPFGIQPVPGGRRLLVYERGGAQLPREPGDIIVEVPRGETAVVYDGETIRVYVNGVLQETVKP